MSISTTASGLRWAAAGCGQSFASAPERTPESTCAGSSLQRLLRFGDPSAHPAANSGLNQTRAQYLYSTAAGGSTRSHQIAVCAASGPCGQPSAPNSASSDSSSDFNFESVPPLVSSGAFANVWQQLGSGDVKACASAPSSLPATASRWTAQTTACAHTSTLPPPEHSQTSASPAFQKLAAQADAQMQLLSIPVPAVVSAARPATEFLSGAAGAHAHQQQHSSPLQSSWDLSSAYVASTNTSSTSMSDAVALGDDQLFVPAIDPSDLLALGLSPDLNSHVPKPPAHMSSAAHWWPHVASSNGASFWSDSETHTPALNPAAFAPPLSAELPPLAPDRLGALRLPPANASADTRSSAASTSQLAQSVQQEHRAPLASRRSCSGAESVLSDEQRPPPPLPLGVGSSVKLTNGANRELADAELMRLSVKELNRRLQRLGVPREAAQAFKHRRRTLKNRGYAYRCRQRRVSGQRELRDQVLRLERDLAAANAARGALAAECALLRAACAATGGALPHPEQ